MFVYSSADLSQLLIKSLKKNNKKKLIKIKLNEKIAVFFNSIAIYECKERNFDLKTITIHLVK